MAIPLLTVLSAARWRDELQKARSSVTTWGPDNRKTSWVQTLHTQTHGF